MLHSVHLYKGIGLPKLPFTGDFKRVECLPLGKANVPPRHRTEPVEQPVFPQLALRCVGKRDPQHLIGSRPRRNWQARLTACAVRRFKRSDEGWDRRMVRTRYLNLHNHRTAVLGSPQGLLQECRAEALIPHVDNRPDRREHEAE